MRPGARLPAWVGIALVVACGCGDDATNVDAGRDASARMDAGSTPFDAGRVHDARTDAAPPATDAAVRDAAGDGGDDDAGALDAGGDAGLPHTLAATGLYENAALTVLADGVEPFAPSYALWSDDATKKRWLYLPAGKRIDTSDMDAWKFPVGTKAFKEFTRDGKRVETRMLYKTKAGWYMMAYAWNAKQAQAVAVPDGVQNALGTDHDIPSSDACRECHEGVTDRLLGVSALQLSHDKPGLDVKQLAAADRLSDPPSGDFRLPATAEWNALGYLHANCGNCHNPASVVFDRVDMQLWLPVGALASATSTPSYTTTVGVALSETDTGYTTRVIAKDADMSGLVHRMELRGDLKQMPPLASELVDTTGAGLVRTWISGL